MMSFNSIFLFSVVIISNSCRATPLDDYVNTPDPMFSWQRLETYSQTSHTLYILNMTSQKWLDGKYSIFGNIQSVNLSFFFVESISSQSIWWHYIAITVPRTIRRANAAFLYIGGGDNIDS